MEQTRPETGFRVTINHRPGVSCPRSFSDTGDIMEIIERIEIGYRVWNGCGQTIGAFRTLADAMRVHPNAIIVVG